MNSKKFFHWNISFLLLFILQISIVFCIPPTANISIEPDSATVIVGEEVLFDASASTDDKSLDEGRFEWTFGDGYTLKRGEPYPSEV